MTAASIAAVLRGVPTPIVSPSEISKQPIACSVARDPGHRRRGDLALVGAADHAGDVAAHPHAARQRRLRHDRPEALQALRDRAVDVLLREGLRRGAEHRDLVGTGGQRRLQALQVGHQHRIAHARPLCGPRAAPRRCRPSAAPISARRRSPPRSPAARPRPAPRSAPPWPRPATGIGSFCSPSRGPTSTMVTSGGTAANRSAAVTPRPRPPAGRAAPPPPRPGRPRAHARPSTSPSRGASKRLSIFIASSTASGWPLRRPGRPAATSSLVTLPGIGCGEQAAVLLLAARGEAAVLQHQRAAAAVEREGQRVADDRGREAAAQPVALDPDPTVGDAAAGVQLVRRRAAR